VGYEKITSECIQNLLCFDCDTLNTNYTWYGTCVIANDQIEQFMHVGTFQFVSQSI